MPVVLPHQLREILKHVVLHEGAMYCHSRRKLTQSNSARTSHCKQGIPRYFESSQPWALLDPP